jgi:hypothetical protein
VSLFDEHLESQTKLARRSRSLDYNQFKEMHVIRSVGRPRRWIPEFATDDGQLRSVIIHATLGYIFRAGKVPADITTDREYLKELASDRQAWAEAMVSGSLNAHWQSMEQYIAAVRGCGGYMEMLGAVAYRAYRLRWHDEDIAASLAMTTVSVRTIRFRLLRYAERLGFTTYERRKDVLPAAVHELIASMWSQSATVKQIAANLGSSGQFVRHSLRMQGLYGLRHPRRGCDLEKRRACARKATRTYRERQFLKTVAWG